MNELAITLLGVLAFGLAIGYDIANLARRYHLKIVVQISVSVLFLLALGSAICHPDKMSMPGWIVALGGTLSGLGMVLLAYSLGIELSFRRTYLTAEAPGQLVTTGTYALTRHPGVLWLGLWLLGLALVSRSRVLLLAGPLWLATDIFYVWLQDRYFFPRQFPDYGRYQSQTPMLWPTRASIKRCLATLPWQQSRTSSQ